MRLADAALQLTVFLSDNDTWHHRPLYTEIVRRAHRAGLAGASVLHGVEGYGATHRIHTARLLSLAENLPVIVIIIDTEDRIRDFLPQLNELITEGLATIEPVEAIRYG